MIRSGGTTRIVLCVGPIAFKIARDNRGARCNCFEADLYRASDARRRAMLCPPLWCSANGAVLVMRRAEPIPENEFYEIRDTGRLPDWDYRGPGDVESPFEWKPSDWGWLDGRIVAVDYSTPMLD
jgi:hypothetical protein